jgi:hypothetical protein
MRYLLIALSYVFAVPAIVCGEISERLRTLADKMEPPRAADDDGEDWPSVRFGEWPPDADRLAVLSLSENGDPVIHLSPDRVLEQHGVVKGTVGDAVVP